MFSQRGKGRVLLSVLKVPAGSRADVVVLDGQVAGLATHWHSERSWACGGERCPLCSVGIPTRWVGFYPVVTFGDASGRVRILEMSATAYDRFQGLCRLEEYPSIEGVVASCSRKKKSSPLVVEPMGAAEPGMVKRVDRLLFFGAIARLYGLPGPRDGEDLEEWKTRAELAACKLLSAV